jgi:lipoate-protein ligase A
MRKGPQTVPLPAHACQRAGADYVFGERKFGGNAQSIIKGRWVHHTSFLWDFQPAHMALLQHPPRMPAYRQARCRGSQAWLTC